MKLSEIIRIAKKQKVAIIETDIDEQQWLNTGKAIYKLEGMPYLTSDIFLNIANVSEKQKENWFKEDRTDRTGIYKTDKVNEIEITADMAGISILYNGSHIVPFYLPDGVIWIDNDYLKPLENCKSEYLRFFVRGETNRVLAVKEGLILIALILEYELQEHLMEKLELMEHQCKMQIGQL